MMMLPADLARVLEARVSEPAAVGVAVHLYTSLEVHSVEENHALVPSIAHIFARKISEVLLKEK
jgi:hypothetical protein